MQGKSRGKISLAWLLIAKFVEDVGKTDSWHTSDRLGKSREWQFLKAKVSLPYNPTVYS